MNIEAKLAELGLKLPNPPAVAGSYVPSVRTGNLLYLAGTISSFNGEMTHVAFGHLGVSSSFPSPHVEGSLAIRRT